MRKLYTLVILFSLFASNKIFAQASYLGLDGGFEGTATIDNAGNFAAPQTGKWSKANNNITIAGETGTVRSGGNSIKVSSSTSSTARMFSPQFTISASTTKWVIQCYRRATSTTATVQFQLGNFRGATEALSGTYAPVTAANTWEKVTYAPTSVTSATTVAADIIAKMATSAGDVYLDDFAVYESSTGVDVTAANAPTAPGTANPTGSSLDVSWTAASGGVDGGGYMVVRGLTDPTTTPNANGIYAVGNTTAAGETVMYVGTGTSFTDNTGMSASTTYYYRIYTFDKAYNYSTAATTNGTTSGVCLAPTTAATSITFASTTTTTTTVNWTSGNGSKRIVVARLGSAVTWTPTDNTTYAANASFGSGTDVSGSGEYVVYNGNAATVPVTNLAATSTYYFKVYEYNCTAGSEKYYLTSPPSNSVLTPASVSVPTFSTPVCLSYGGATVLVSFTSTGTFSGNTYNVEMSSAAGSWAAPTVIGTTVSNANTITNLSCTIPYGTVGGTGYLLRVTASGPATTGTASAAFTISTNSISPLTTQNNSPGVNGGTLTVSGYTASTILWKYGTASGGPYGTSLGAGTTQVTTLPLTGTYYMVCTNTYATCGLVTSAEVQLNVTLPAVTGVTFSNACLNDASLSWTLPTGFNGTNNTILVFAKASSAVTVGTPTNAASSYTASTTFGSGTPYQNDASAFCIYNGTSNTVNITGLSPGITYNFLVQNVQNSPTVYATAATQTGATLSAPSDVTGLAAVTANGEITLNWTNPTACWDDIMVVATDGGSVTATPTGNGSLYFDNNFYGDAASNVNLPSNEFDVYQGTGSSIIVSSLLNGQAYAFKVFVRKGTVWSTGATISATPTTVAGDYQSTISGNWDSPSTWLIYNGSSWVAATTFPNRKDSCQVTIVNGTTVTVNTSNRTCAKLIVNTGGKLYANLVPTSSNLKYLNVFGNIQNDGTIGNGATDDALGFNIEGSTCTISGTGVFHANRIRKNDNINTTTALTINMDMLLTWNGTVLFNNQSSTIFNITINAGKTVSTSTNYGNVSVDGTSGNGSGNMRGTITVKGTFNINGILFMTTDNGAGSTIGMTITSTGIVNVDSVNAADGASAGHNLIIQNGGLLNIYGLSAIYLFGNSKNTYTCSTGSTVNYSGAGAQIIESGITYANLTESGSGNKTINGNLTVNGSLTIDAAVFNVATSIKTLNLQLNLTLQNGGTMSDNCKTLLNITTFNTASIQLFTGNNQLIKCFNFTSAKTAGKVEQIGPSGFSDLYIKNTMSIDFTGTAKLIDNGNTINVGNDVEWGSATSTSANFTITGTLKFVCIGATVSTDIHLSNFAGTGVTVANLYNLSVDAETGSLVNQVQIFPAAGGQSLTINGSVNIQNTAALTDLLNPNNNTLTVKGNWTDYAATGFTEGTGQVILSGTAAQNIFGAESFNKLEINNSNGVTINSNTVVTTELKLTNGTVTTGANELQVTSNSVSSVTGYSIASYVAGNLRRIVSSTGIYDFPVGNSNYQLATVQLNSSSGMSSILAFFNTTITGTAPSYPTTQINGEGIYGILNSGFWTITPNAYTAVNYDITLNQRGYSNFSGSATQLGVIKRPNSGSTWAGTNLSGSNGFHSNATQSIASGTAVAKRSGVTAFSDFAEGFGGSPLPVTLSSFTLAEQDNKAVVLNWRTEAEINCAYYSVERSEDGISFNSIGKIPGNGTSDQPHTYQLIDYKPICAESYYRLRQFDISLEEHLSNILSATISCNGISINPNLVLDNLYFKMLSKDITGPLKITVLNIDGRLVINSVLNYEGNNFALDVSSLPAGLYFIQLTNGVETYSDRFMKQ